MDPPSPTKPNQTKPNPPPTTTIQIAWNDPANPAVGFKYLYLSPEDYEVRLRIGWILVGAGPWTIMPDDTSTLIYPNIYHPTHPTNQNRASSPARSTRSWWRSRARSATPSRTSSDRCVRAPLALSFLFRLSLPT